MDSSPLVNDVTDRVARLLRRIKNDTQVSMAFLLHDGETGQWTTYLALRELDEVGSRVAYDRINKVIRQTEAPSAAPLPVRLVRITDPVVKAAVALFRGRPPGVPCCLQVEDFCGTGADRVCLVRGLAGELPMATGRQTLEQIIDGEAEFFQQHGRSPRKIKLPVLMAYDLAKCGREDLGEISGRVFKQGIAVFAQEGFHGMNVEIVHDPAAELQFE